MKRFEVKTFGNIEKLVMVNEKFRQQPLVVHGFL